tara:strand:+ start:1655 stop:2803 length:1149 start_codon:yes stop_codon:yes gene_type:complete
MKKQKICIIGGSLTGLVTAISLSKLNCQIDLITGTLERNSKSSRTIAISENNFKFLDKLNITKSFKKETWPCSIMKLYSEINGQNFSKVFELNNFNKQERILYMLENSKIVKQMMLKIKKIKSISIKKNEKVSSISNLGLLKNVKFENNNHKYNLVIVCTGHNSDLVRDIFSDKVVKRSYDESSITTILNHNSLNNNTVRQIFLDNEIFALLPISNTRTSIVWSTNNNVKKKNNLYIKKKIKFYTKTFLTNVTFPTKIEYKNLNFLIREKYYKDRILLFGDALHVIHPFIGQGFNMTLRDLAILEKILRTKINLGLDVGSSDILNEFSNVAKPRNFIYSIGVDFLKSSISYKQLRNVMLKIADKSSFVKDIFFNAADKGLKF